MKNRKGFTLVELLAVIAIIAIVSLAGVATYNAVKKSIEEGLFKSKLTTLVESAKLYGEDIRDSIGTKVNINSEDYTGTSTTAGDLIDSNYFSTEEKDSDGNIALITNIQGDNTNLNNLKLYIYLKSNRVTVCIPTSQDEDVYEKVKDYITDYACDGSGSSTTPESDPTPDTEPDPDSEDTSSGVGITLSDYIISLKDEKSYTNIEKDTHDEYTNYRYIGADPDNYVYYNCDDYNNPTADTCELWRIVGVFNKDSTGVDEQLVKLVRADSIGSYWYDTKAKGVGSCKSSAKNYGSNDWSDAQVMLFLNGINFTASGSYISNAYDPTDPTKTLLHQDYYYSSNCLMDSQNHCIIKYTGSSYYKYNDGDLLYTPFSSSKETITTNYDKEGVEPDSTLTPIKNDATRNMMQKVTWPLYSINGADYANAELLYLSERGITKSGSREIVKNMVWEGYIGLIYASDYHYATAGGRNGYTRSKCISATFHNMVDYSGTWHYCTDNDWLTAKQYTMTTNIESTTTGDYNEVVLIMGETTSYGSATSDYPVDITYGAGAGVRPSIYLKHSIKACTSDEAGTVVIGEGTKSNPYTLCS